jgi:hypothetical protein
MDRHAIRFVWLALGLGAVLTAPSIAGEADSVCCARCGRPAVCRRVCHLACAEKKIEAVCWDTKREDFCVPGPSKPGCRHCEDACPDVDCAHGRFGGAQRFVWREWFPTSAKVYTRTRLMKKVQTRTVQRYQWVVQDLCAQCQAECRQLPVSSPPQGSPAPAAGEPPIPPPPPAGPPAVSE